MHGFIGESARLPVELRNGDIVIEGSPTGLRADGSGEATLFFRPHHVEVADRWVGCLSGSVVGSRRLTDTRRLEVLVGSAGHRVEIDVPVHHPAAERASVAFRPTAFRLYGADVGAAPALRKVVHA